MPQCIIPRRPPVAVRSSSSCLPLYCSTVCLLGGRAAGRCGPHQPASTSQPAPATSSTAAGPRAAAAERPRPPPPRPTQAAITHHHSQGRREEEAKKKSGRNQQQQSRQQQSTTASRPRPPGGGGEGARSQVRSGGGGGARGCGENNWLPCLAVDWLLLVRALQGSRRSSSTRTCWGFLPQAVVLVVRPHTASTSRGPLVTRQSVVARARPRYHHHY